MIRRHSGPPSFKCGSLEDGAEGAKAGNPEEDATGKGKGEEKGFDFKLVTSE